MPVNYGVLRGKVIDFIPYQGGSDHFQIEIEADQLYRIAVDVYSQFAGARQKYAHDGNTTLDTNRMVMYYRDEDFKHPIIEKLVEVETGFTPKVALDKSLWLDYLRTEPSLFPINEMKVVAPKTTTKLGDNLNDDIDPSVKKACKNQNAEVYAFGSGWDDNALGGRPDVHPYFNPNPSVGIHDIHMNQGDYGKEQKYNGIYQDGALLFHFKDNDKWVAMFFRFQVQKTNTDNNGNPI